ncbi:MAG: shikimate kinase [Bacteroidia bacterium]
MKKMDRVFLIGPPAAGKTTIGRRWARQLRIPFYDTDAEIIRRTGYSIREWFDRGEPAFRAIEREIITQTIIENTRGIWAVGGGFPAQSGAMTLLNSTGYTVWIDPPPEWLLSRLRHPATERPLLEGLSDDERLFLIERRRVYYRYADLHWRPDMVPENLLLAWIKHQFRAFSEEEF